MGCVQTIIFAKWQVCISMKTWIYAMYFYSCSSLLYNILWDYVIAYFSGDFKYIITITHMSMLFCISPEMGISRCYIWRSNSQIFWIISLRFYHITVAVQVLLVSSLPGTCCFILYYTKARTFYLLILLLDLYNHVIYIVI